MIPRRITVCGSFVMIFSVVGPELIRIPAMMLTYITLFVIVLALFLVIALLEPGSILICNPRVTP